MMLVENGRFLNGADTRGKDGFLILHQSVALAHHSPSAASSAV